MTESQLKAILPFIPEEYGHRKLVVDLYNEALAAQAVIDAARRWAKIHNDDPMSNSNCTCTLCEAIEAYDKAVSVAEEKR